jgi:hypothetical protein
MAVHLGVVHFIGEDVIRRGAQRSDDLGKWDPSVAPMLRGRDKWDAIRDGRRSTIELQLGGHGLNLARASTSRRKPHTRPQDMHRRGAMFDIQ